MRQLTFDVTAWLGGGDGDAVSRATLGSLEICAGDGIPVTEVEDKLARTVRPHINVPAYPVIEWLLANWWRLRWEGRTSESRRPNRAWRHAHSLAAIGGDHPWPPLEFSSDGEFIHLEMNSEVAPDVSAIRYLRNIVVDVPAAQFEAAVEEFADLVEGRLGALHPNQRCLSELRAELRDERAHPTTARGCKWQALAGIDPGEASDEWLAGVGQLVEEAGASAGEEIIGALPELAGDVNSANRAVEAMRSSTTTIDLSFAEKLAATSVPGELPWERGARLAAEVKARLKIAPGVVTNDRLRDLLSSHLPLPTVSWKGSRALCGGFRNGITNGRTAVLVVNRRVEQQRFYLARMIAGAVALSSDQHVIPVTNSGTALQKFERSFAQEFLCPWAALDAFTDEHGTDAEGIADAAQHFLVSEWLVQSTLVNRKKLPRDRLPSP